MTPIVESEGPGQAEVNTGWAARKEAEKSGGPARDTRKGPAGLASLPCFMAPLSTMALDKPYSKSSLLAQELWRRFPVSGRRLWRSRSRKDTEETPFMAIWSAYTGKHRSWAVLLCDQPRAEQGQNRYLQELLWRAEARRGGTEAMRETRHGWA